MKKPAHSFLKSLVAPLSLGLLIPAGALLAPGCKKDEPPPPLPSSEPVAAPSAPLELAIEDAGPEADADAEAGKKPTGPYVPQASLKACCNALSQNAANAPEPTKTYMLQAAAACSAAAAQGKTSAAGAIQGLLRGAGMPAACR